MELEKKLTDLSADLQTFVAKAADEKKEYGAMHEETKSAIAKIRTEIDALHTQLDAVDAKLQTGQVEAPQETIGALFTKHERFQEAKRLDFPAREKINVPIQGTAFPRAIKTVISDTGLGAGTSGVIMPTRLPGIIGLPQQALRIRDLLPVRTLSTGHSFDYVVQNTRTNATSPQIETSPKAESTYGWTIASGTVRTIAHYTNVSRQALDDVNWLRNQIDTELMYGLKLKEEAEILAGVGTGEHLDGIANQATAFDTTLLSAAAGYTRLDVLRWAKLQVRLAGLATFAASGIVLHPTDLAHIEVTKDGFGRYIVGDPKTGVDINYIWGLPVVESDSITSGTFLIGAFATAAQVIDRMLATIEISYEHNVNFTSNLATVLAEERIGLAVTRPTAFVTGTFAVSPSE